MRVKFATKDREFSELRMENTTIKTNSEYIEGVKNGLKDELERLRKSKED